MRPTFLGFEASKSALFASQKALDITGNNLANISSEGYTRQRVDQVSVANSNYGGKYYNGGRVALAGMGTDIVGISQTRNKQLDAAFRKQYSEVGEYSQRSAMLTDIESVLQELDIGTDGNGYGLRYAIQQMYTSLQDFAMDTSSVTNASVAAASFTNFAQTLRQMSAKLDEKASQYKAELEIDVANVNTMLEKLATLNKDISKAMIAGGYTEEYGPNELLDQRNLILDELSAYGKLEVKYNPDGTATVKMGDNTVVENDMSEVITFAENNDGTVAVQWRSTGESIGSGTGILRASMEIINGRGTGTVSSRESAAKGFLYYKDKLNEIAGRVADVCNNTIPDEFDKNGNVVSYKKLFGAEVTDETGTHVYPDMYISADNIKIMDEVSKDPNALLMGEGNTENKYVLELIANLSTQKIAFSNGNATFEDYISDYLTTLGNDISYYDTRNESATTVSNEILDSRDSTMGVSENEETVNMLTYNRAYQAAARMMTVMDELLDVLINQMGRN